MTSKKIMIARVSFLQNIEKVFPNNLEVRKKLLLILAWGRLGWHDVRSKYRRTFLGPFWIVLTTGLTVGCLGTVYVYILNIDWKSYLPFVTAGIVIWYLISTLLINGSLALITHKHVFHSMKLSPIMPVIRVVVTSHIEFIHNMVVFIFVAVICKISLNINQLLVIPAFVFLFINGLWSGVLIALICTRFRDLQPFVSAVVGVLFLITPIIWLPEMLGNRKFIADLNPFTHYLSIFRDPLLGNIPSLTSWLIVVGTTLLGVIVTTLFYMRVRKRFIFWL